MPRLRLRRTLLCAVTVVTAVVLPSAATAATAAGVEYRGGAAAAGSTGSTLWATQLDFDDHGVPWSEASLAALKADGLNSVEINMSWNAVEPSPGTFDFTELDQELANAAAAGMRIVPIFWQSGWSGSPASWVTGREVSSTGAQGVQPVWWDPVGQQQYFGYVTGTVAHIAHNRGYGGSILNYGFLDAQWDINGGAGGWAPADISEFRQVYLPAAYGTIAAFNARYGTSYTSFDQVPAASPGQPLAEVYQAFRVWSMEDTYGRLTAAVRKVTSGPLYYYFGGHLANEPAYANNPDSFFKLARQYDVTVLLDSAQASGLALTFGSLARAYHVRLAQEWTAPGRNDQLAAAAVNWLSNYGIGFPQGGGEDFFIHDGTAKDVYGFPIYIGWLPTLQRLSGSYPRQLAAVYIDVSQGYGNASGGSLLNAENDLASLWERDQSGFAVVTSQEVANGAVRLSQYKAILPLNGVDATLRSYQASGGVVLTQDSQLATYAPAYAQLSSPYSLHTVPTVAADHRSASITLAEVSPYFGYDGTGTFSPAGLTLRAGTYHLVDAATGNAVPQRAEPDGDVCAPVTMAAATLAEWTMVPGAAPAGTPVPSVCPKPPGSGTSSVSVSVGQSTGMVFLGVGDTGRGADSNLSVVTQGGSQAVQTWTSAQSGVPGAYVYLQVDPSSAVAATSDLAVTVTYWASAGQGFQVQYDAPGNAYQNGPAVASTGTGTWETATVNITGAQLSEEQNLSADLRLAVTDPSAPLIVKSVSISTS
jgi:Beta-galactosidase